MKAQDWQDQENNRNKAVAKLADFCDTVGLSWSATENAFVIQLPLVTDTSVIATAPERKTFDISKWGERGIDETTDVLPEDFQMPDYGEQLEEGQPPKGDPNEEA